MEPDTHIHIYVVHPDIRIHYFLFVKLQRKQVKPQKRKNVMFKRLSLNICTLSFGYFNFSFKLRGLLSDKSA